MRSPEGAEEVWPHHVAGDCACSGEEVALNGPTPLQGLGLELHCDPGLRPPLADSAQGCTPPAFQAEAGMA